jgi:hypothetical protein
MNRSDGTLGKYRYLDGQKSIGWDDIRNAFFPVGQVRCHSNLAPTTDSHAFHAIEKACEHIFSIYPQRCEQHCPVVFDLALTIEPPALLPPNRIAAVEPHAKTNIVVAMPQDLSTIAGLVF